MTQSSDPDQDKTNPNPKYIHQTFDEDNDTEQGAKPVDLTKFDEDLSGEAIDLYDAADFNAFENEIEASRVEPYPAKLRTNELYPDELLLSREGDPQTSPDLSRREAAVEECYGGAADFDPLGDEGNPEETRPIENEPGDEPCP